VLRDVVKRTLQHMATGSVSDKLKKELASLVDEPGNTDSDPSLEHILDLVLNCDDTNSASNNVSRLKAVVAYFEREDCAAIGKAIHELIAPIEHVTNTLFKRSALRMKISLETDADKKKELREEHLPCFRSKLHLSPHGWSCPTYDYSLIAPSNKLPIHISWFLYFHISGRDTQLACHATHTDTLNNKLQIEV
jgi:hypothetical protein